MKIIFSRKGFDSQYGGFPSPILPDGRMISLPIPSSDDIHYSELRYDNRLSYLDLMLNLKSEYKSDKAWHELKKSSRCHLDPDLHRDVFPRKKGWKPIFGQIDAAQTHLENEGLKEGDLFLFFGTFRQTEFEKGRLTFIRTNKPRHIIFGYLQIGEIVKVDIEKNTPTWMEYHPHNCFSRRKAKNNTIYVSSEQLSWNPELKGAGVFSFNERLVLTKQGFSKSKWELEPFFKKVRISCHSSKNWKSQGYFQTIGIGQEFVVHADRNVEAWAKNLVNESKSDSK